MTGKTRRYLTSGVVFGAIVLSAKTPHGLLSHLSNSQGSTLSRIHCHSPKHDCPLPKNPGLQVQIWDPMVLLHVALWWHKSVFVAHSSISKIWIETNTYGVIFKHLVPVYLNKNGFFFSTTKSNTNRKPKLVKLIKFNRLVADR